MTDAEAAELEYRHLVLYEAWRTDLLCDPDEHAYVVLSFQALRKGRTFVVLRRGRSVYGAGVAVAARIKAKAAAVRARRQK